MKASNELISAPLAFGLSGWYVPAAHMLAFPSSDRRLSLFMLLVIQYYQDCAQSSKVPFYGIVEVVSGILAFRSSVILKLKVEV
jgi:hypothetical protein